MRRLRVTVRLVTALIGAAAAGCQRTSAEPETATLVNEPFFIRGTLTETRHPWGYRLRGEPGTGYHEKEAYFRIGPETKILKADGTAAAAADLIVGREMTLWITGPIAESYPVQVHAQRIVLK
jgi:hypothetical protein